MHCLDSRPSSWQPLAQRDAEIREGLSAEHSWKK